MADEYGRILERLHAEQPCNVALKLTHLGLDFDEELAYANVERVVKVAEALGTFVRIDMEQSSVVDATLAIYRRLREAGHDRVGTVLQSYLFRTEGDPRRAAPGCAQPALRQGGVPRASGGRVRRQGGCRLAFARLVETALLGGAYPAIATHDERLIERLIAFAEREGDGRPLEPPDALRRAFGPAARAVRRGFKVLVATPYGPEWYPYLMRRRGASGEPRLHSAERRSPVTASCAPSRRGLAAAVHLDLGENRLQVILHGVPRDEDGAPRRRGCRFSARRSAATCRSRRVSA